MTSAKPSKGGGAYYGSTSKGTISGGLGAVPRSTDRRTRDAHPQRALTVRQAYVLRLHEDGYSLNQIARDLGWKPDAKGRYNGAGIRVMLDVALNKTGGTE